MPRDRDEARRGGGRPLARGRDERLGGNARRPVKHEHRSPGTIADRGSPMFVTTLALTPRTPQWLDSSVRYVSRGIREVEIRDARTALELALELRQHRA